MAVASAAEGGDGGTRNNLVLPALEAAKGQLYTDRFCWNMLVKIFVFHLLFMPNETVHSSIKQVLAVLQFLLPATETVSNSGQENEWWPKASPGPIL